MKKSFNQGRLSENIFYASVSKVIQYVAAGADLPVRPGLHSCWVGACALSCLHKPSCQLAGSQTAAWPSQTEPQPDLMRSGPLRYPEECEEIKSFSYLLRLVYFVWGFFIKMMHSKQLMPCKSSHFRNYIIWPHCNSSNIVKRQWSDLHWLF